MNARPNGPVADVHVSAERQARYGAIVRDRVDALLADEQRCADRQARHQPRMDPAEWKFVRSHEVQQTYQMQVYRRRRRDRSLAEMAAEEDFVEAARVAESGQPSTVVLGRVNGSIEDLLYGLSYSTQEEMQTVVSYQGSKRAECRLLKLLETATNEDPLHYLGLTWVYTKSPLPMVVVPRDVCCAVGQGQGRDVRGERYGYLVVHSVELPENTPLGPKKSNTIRVKMYYSCLLREKAPGIVDVMVRGICDLGGDLSRLASPELTTLYITGLVKAVGCSEAKKLTLLARHHAVTGRNRDPLQQLETIAKGAVCSVCIKRDRLSIAMRLRPCRICGVIICSKCSTKKPVFLGSHRPYSTVSCCPACVQEAHRMVGVSPTDPEYIVVADYFFKPPSMDLTRCTSSSDLTQYNLESHCDSSEKAKFKTSDSWSGWSGQYSYTDVLSDGDSGTYRLSPSDDGDAEGRFESQRAPQRRQPDRLATVTDSPQLRARVSESDWCTSPPARMCDLSRSSPAVSRDFSQSYKSSGHSAPHSSGNDNRVPRDEKHVITSEASDRVEALLEKMIKLQTTAEEARAITKANKELLESLR